MQDHDHGLARPGIVPASTRAERWQAQQTVAAFVAHEAKGIFCGPSALNDGRPLHFLNEDNMPNKIIQDRACGAIMGAFIGDALALGPHWYYNLAELRRDSGIGSTTILIPNPADTTKASKQVNFPRQVSSSSSCFAPLLIVEVTIRRIIAVEWMKSSFHFSTEHR